MSAGSSYEYLKLEMWHTLLARALIFRAIASRLGDLCNAVHDQKKYGGSVKTALQLLYQTSDDVAGNADTDLLAVAEVVQHWLAEIEKIARAPSAEDEARRLLSRLQELLSELQEFLAEGAVPDPFRELLDRVGAQAAAVYGVSWRQVSFSLLHLREHPRPPGGDRDPYALTATTKVDDGQARIELQVYPAEFGPEAYAAMPMIFTHECVCHVPAQQFENRNASPFAEGFLDWAAIFFFDMWMALLDSELTPAAKRHAAQLGAIRKEIGRTAWAERIGGHEAADVLATWFETEMRYSAPEAQAKVARLAVELNKASARLEKKDLFVSELQSPLSPELRRVLRAWEGGTAPATALLDLPLPDLP
jgi:hypothetical protein